MTNIYSLEFLLDKTFKELNERDLNKYNKLIIPKPDVIYVNRKTLFKNFREVCYKLNRKENDFSSIKKAMCTLYTLGIKLNLHYQD